MRTSIRNAHIRYDVNASGIRVIGSEGTVIRNCRLHDNDMGIMSGELQHLTIEGCEVDHNGGSQFAHNLYLAGDNVTIRDSYIHGSTTGINVKSRAHYTQLLYNYIANGEDGEVDLVDDSTYEGNLGTGTPNSNALMLGNLVVSKPNCNPYGNHSRFIHFGADGSGGWVRNGTLFLDNNTLVATEGSIQFLQTTMANGSIQATNNIFFGADAIVGDAHDGPITGTNNWMPSTAAVPAGFVNTTAGVDPGFDDVSRRDFRLSPTA